MRSTLRILAVSALLAGVGGPAAFGATLATAPVPNNIPMVHTVWCDITNIDGVPREITIDVIDAFGGVVTTSGPVLLSPSMGWAHSETTGLASWCRFTVSGSAKKFRALAVYDDGTHYTVSVPAY